MSCTSSERSRRASTATALRCRGSEVRGEDRSSFLGGALALLHLIDFDEPFGFSVVEAMACGTPVIAFDRGSMSEIIREESTGFVVTDRGKAASEAVQAGW